MKANSTININSLNYNYLQTIKISEDEILELIPLGSGSEVGRSCLFLKFAGIKIMLDCGIHPAHNGLISLPFFDVIDPSEVDLLLITHFHLDHCGALPYFLTKTTFKGKCYMTQPTKELYKFLISDYIKVSQVSKSEESLYNESDLEKSYNMINEVDFKQTICFNIRNTNIKFTAYNAGHVLGAAMFLIEIEDVSILYTGDFSREEDRHLQPADLPNVKVNVLIVESTYGIQKHDPRNEREHMFKKLVTDVVRKKGKCLLPVMISGRVQELLLILEECWAKEEDLRQVKIFFVSSLATKCLEIFKKNINIMGEKIKRNHLVEGTRNPFDFDFITSVKNKEEMMMKGYDENKPCVVFASPGMLQQGLSRDLFEMWYNNENNATIITGYCVEGTFAKELLKDHEEVKLSNGKRVKLNMKVHNVTFSAHSDFNDTKGFIEHLKPKKIVLVHGESREMKRLKDEIERRIKVSYELEFSNKSKGKPINSNDLISSSLVSTKIYNPQNCQRIQFYYKIKKSRPVFIVGKLYDQLYKNILNNSISTTSMQIDSEIEAKTNVNTEEISLKIKQDEDILKEDNFIEFNGLILENKLLLKDDIEEMTNYIPMKIRNVLQVKYNKDFNTLIYCLKTLFKLEQKDKCLYNNNIEVKIFDLNYFFSKSLEPDTKVVLNWYSSTMTDTLADSIAQVIYYLDCFPSSSLAREYTSKSVNIDSVKKRMFNYFSSKYYIKIEENNIILFSNNDFKESSKICSICLLSFDIIFNDQDGNEAKFKEETINYVKNDLEFFLQMLV